MGSNSLVAAAIRLWHRPPSASAMPGAPPDRAAPSAPARAGWQATMYADVGDFLFDNRLDPTPDHYDLAWQFRAATNARLVAAVRAELDATGIVSADAAERIFAESAGPVTPAALAAMADRMQAQVGEIARVARTSGADAAAFADTLETQCAGDAAPEAILLLARSMVARTRVAAAQLRRSSRELKTLRATLAEAQHCADTDPLTDLPNRRAFKRALEAALTTAHDEGAPLALAFCDIDQFKALNDTHGHDTGDRVLRFVASLLVRHFKAPATVGRFGGEEFVILLPGLAAEAAAARVDRCREDLASRCLVAARDDRRLGKVTFSAGLAEAAPGDTTADLLRRADEALYRAKGAGRNRIERG